MTKHSSVLLLMNFSIFEYKIHHSLSNDNRKTYCVHVKCDQAVINSFGVIFSHTPLNEIILIPILP